MGCFIPRWFTPNEGVPGLGGSHSYFGCYGAKNKLYCVWNRFPASWSCSPSRSHYSESRFIYQSLWALGYIRRACCHCDALVHEVSVLPGGTDVPSSKVGLAFCIVDLVVNVSDVTLSTPARACVCVAAVSYCTGYIRSLLCHKRALSRLSLWHWAYHMLVGTFRPSVEWFERSKNPKTLRHCTALWVLQFCITRLLLCQTVRYLHWEWHTSVRHMCKLAPKMSL